MRFRTLVIWVVLLGFVAWGAYTIVVAGSSYLAAAGVVDQAVSDAIARRKAQIGSGMTQEASRDFVPNVRSNILGGAKARGIELKPGDLAVAEAAEGVRVSAEWSLPVTLYDDYVVFNLPMSVTRSYTVH